MRREQVPPTLTRSRAAFTFFHRSSKELTGALRHPPRFGAVASSHGLPAQIATYHQRFETAAILMGIMALEIQVATVRIRCVAVLIAKSASLVST